MTFSSPQPSNSWTSGSKASPRCETNKIRGAPPPPPPTVPQLEVAEGHRREGGVLGHQARTSCEFTNQKQAERAPSGTLRDWRLTEVPTSQQSGVGEVSGQREPTTAGTPCIPFVWSLSTPRTQVPQSPAPGPPYSLIYQ